jgi:hypothetical protein
MQENGEYINPVIQPNLQGSGRGQLYRTREDFVRALLEAKEQLKGQNPSNGRGR